MTIREIFTVSVVREGRGLPKGVQLLGYVASCVVMIGLAWLGKSIHEDYGWWVGLALGIVAGTYITTEFFRSYRARQRQAG